MRWGAILLTMLSTATVVGGCSDEPAAGPKATTTTDTPVLDVGDPACEDIGVTFTGTRTLPASFGWTSDGAKLWTTAGGGRWQSFDLPEHESLYDIEFVDAQRGWIAARAIFDWGVAPGIFATVDGGETWTFAPAGIGPGLHGGSFMTIDVDASSREGILVTGDPVGEGGGVAMSHDGGATWDTFPTKLRLLGSRVNLAFGTAWLSSIKPGLPRTTGFFSSEDGHTWTAHEILPPDRDGPPLESYDLPQFTDARHGSIAAIATLDCDAHPDLVIATTGDGGISWVMQSTTELPIPDGGYGTADVAIVRGADVWWASVTRPSTDPATIRPQTLVLQSSDQGRTWAPSSSLPEGAKVTASDGARRVWAWVEGPDPKVADSTLYESRDSGATWTDITPPW